jgi:hypothetical protein
MQMCMWRSTAEKLTFSFTSYVVINGCSCYNVCRMQMCMWRSTAEKLTFLLTSYVVINGCSCNNVCCMQMYMWRSTAKKAPHPSQCCPLSLKTLSAASLTLSGLQSLCAHVAGRV